jgi:hypothetical protein
MNHEFPLLGAIQRVNVRYSTHCPLASCTFEDGAHSLGQDHTFNAFEYLTVISPSFLRWILPYNVELGGSVRLSHLSFQTKLRSRQFDHAVELEIPLAWIDLSRCENPLFFWYPMKMGRWVKRIA